MTLKQELQKGDNVEMRITQKLLELRKAIPYIQKDTKGQNCSYAKGVDLLAVIKPKMDELKLILVPKIINQTLTPIDAGQDKNGAPKYTYLVNGAMSFDWIDTETDKQVCVPWQYFGKHIGDPAQAFGCAMTYAERYFLLKFFQIETDKDDPDARKAKTESVKLISEEQIATLNEWLVSANRTEAQVCTFLKITSFNDLTQPMYTKALSSLKATAGAK